MDEHLGYPKHAAEGRNGGNSRNGTRSKQVTTEVGAVEIDVPRDRDGSFEPKTVRKNQRRLDAGVRHDARSERFEEAAEQGKCARSTSAGRG